MTIVTKKPEPDPKEEALLKALAQGLKGGAGKGDGRVYMGEQSALRGKKTSQMSEAAQAAVGRRTKSIWVSEEEALGDFYGWSTKKQSDFLAAGITGGLLSLGDGALEAGKLWTKLVKEAAAYGKVNQKVSPLDLLAGYVKASGGNGRWESMGAFQVNTVTGEKRFVGPGTYLGNGRAQQVDTRTDMTDPDTAKAIATKLFQDLMGRDPGAGELGGFAKALAAAEANAPVTQTTETQYDMETGQPISSDTRSEGGMTAEGRAYLGEQQIKGKKEYGAVQAATTYQNAFDSLIFGAPE
ncbi:hypothetical protein [Streptomyces paludis]|uniref:Uncharacterized protein n=1 Tax=Streptomyces paludis TaxID=2282738 RepID=A0A345HWS8_9ACTN|nr:hypothetical protein [Streptomyces paludis]AXG81152.1 hypothetical protein DVK44_29570 [Streptomyces paludis]